MRGWGFATSVVLGSLTYYFLRDKPLSVQIAFILGILLLFFALFWYVFRLERK